MYFGSLCNYFVNIISIEVIQVVYIEIQANILIIVGFDPPGPLERILVYFVIHFALAFPTCRFLGSFCQEESWENSIGYIKAFSQHRGKFFFFKTTNIYPSLFQQFRYYCSKAALMVMADAQEAKQKMGGKKMKRLWLAFYVQWVFHDHFA